jgi:hypothetical protein
MLSSARRGPVGLLVLLAVLQAGCLSEVESFEVATACGPRDLSPECCLKRFPGQWERCTGSTELARAVKEAEAAEVIGHTPSLALKLGAGATATVLAAQAVRIGSAERRGVELAASLLPKVEKAIVRCARLADQEVNGHHFNGRSPSRELCQQLKLGEKTTWAAYLGLFKHEQAWPCLREALDKLLPKNSYLLHPRFYVNPRTGKWEYMDPKMMSQILSREGWSGLKGTIEPDIVLLDVNGVIVHVYDLKFPCPESNGAFWDSYTEGRWRDWSQGDLYHHALGVRPRLVSPGEGVEQEMK